ncbi:MAG: hypothetical protein IJS08_12315 [Victivallales bacterium]|nr:hypothetical protein [Victivallales bacterium]
MRNKEKEVECYCTAPDLWALINTPALPLFSCRNCQNCRDIGGGHIGCHGKGVRSDDGREGQWCTIFKPIGEQQ